MPLRDEYIPALTSERPPTCSPPRTAAAGLGLKDADGRQGDLGAPPLPSCWCCTIGSPGLTTRVRTKAHVTDHLLDDAHVKVPFQPRPEVNERGAIERLHEAAAPHPGKATTAVW